MQISVEQYYVNERLWLEYEYIGAVNGLKPGVSVICLVRSSR